MTAPDPRLDEIQARYRDCLTYNFGMRNADKLAHEDIPFLLAELRKAREALADAWDIGVMHGHNANGRLIDKRNENPYAAVAAAKGDERG